jgi:hypothetical protein
LNLRGKEPDWDLKNLAAIYEAVKTVNLHFYERLLVAGQNHYALKALRLLDASAFYIKFSLSGETYETIKSLFFAEYQDGDEDMAIESAPSATDDINSVITYLYQFQSDTNDVIEFPVKLNRRTLKLINKPKGFFPAWTELQHHKCPNCPLDETRHKYCPAACGVSETVEFFKKTLSTEKGKITVKTAERDYSNDSITTSNGISSMMGLIMASSGCPILSKLKPLVRSHLPFATADEALYRALGRYLFTQFFLSKSGKEPDWSLKNFSKLYEEINIVNKAFASRLRSTKIEDASLNALVNLDCFAQIIHLTVSEGLIKDLQQLFKDYWEE